jgi:hypothetical protein
MAKLLVLQLRPLSHNEGFRHHVSGLDILHDGLLCQFSVPRAGPCYSSLLVMGCGILLWEKMIDEIQTIPCQLLGHIAPPGMSDPRLRLLAFWYALHKLKVDGGQRIWVNIKFFHLLKKFKIAQQLGLTLDGLPLSLLS